MKLSMNSTVAFHGTTLRDVQVARAAGYDGVELQTPKLFRYLDAGRTAEDLLPALDGFPVSGVGAIQEAPDDEFVADASRLAAFAEAVRAPFVQMCTGPVDPEVVKDHAAGRLRPDDPRFRAGVGRESEAVSDTARRVGIAAEIAADHGVGIYLEPLGWSPVNRVDQALEILERVDRPNVRLCVDFWHFWVSGDTPDDVAKLPGDLIAGVHVCDGLPVAPGDVPDQVGSRNVWIGGGSIPLQEWIDACRSTGYDGWYCPEIFSRKVAEQDDVEVARTLRGSLQMLLA